VGLRKSRPRADRSHPRSTAVWSFESHDCASHTGTRLSTAARSFECRDHERHPEGVSVVHLSTAAWGFEYHDGAWTERRDPVMQTDSQQLRGASSTTTSHLRRPPSNSQQLRGASSTTTRRRPIPCYRGARASQQLRGASKATTTGGLFLLYPAGLTPINSYVGLRKPRPSARPPSALEAPCYQQLRFECRDQVLRDGVAPLGPIDSCVELRIPQLRVPYFLPSKIMKNQNPIAHPFLKFAGGKTQLLPEILPRLPAKIKTYYEPFLGGGAVFFALAAEKRFERAVLSDANKELMNSYAAIAASLDRIISLLREHESAHSKTYFYEVRASEMKLAISKAARFIYLNRTCFNGLYRVNKSGKFNVPFGDHKNPTICDEENLRAVSAALENAHVSACDFEEAIWIARKGDAIYFDPPYVPISATSNFAAYTKDGFGPDEQERLRHVAEKLSTKGVFVLLSNSDTPFVRELYQGFVIEKVRARRAINSKGDKRGDVGELLIRGR